MEKSVLPSSGIIQKVVNMKNIIKHMNKHKPKTSCEYNNLLLFHFLQSCLEPPIKLKGGNKIKRKIHRKTRRNKNFRKTQKKQKGGSNQMFILFIIMLLTSFARGIQNLEDDDVMDRIKQSTDVDFIFKNYYGTCSLNTMLFLKSIDLPTFENLSKQKIRNELSVSSGLMSKYFTGKQIIADWYDVPVSIPQPHHIRGTRKSKMIENFIENIKNKMISMRKMYNFGDKASLLTAFSYFSYEGEGHHHSVVIWLDSKNRITIIDPQLFFFNEDKNVQYPIYTSDLKGKRIYDENSVLTMIPIEEYIEKYNIVLDDDAMTPLLFTGIHTVIDDENSKFDIDNQKLLETVYRIRDTEEKQQEKTISK